MTSNFHNLTGSSGNTVPASTTGYGKRIIYRPEGRISTGSGARLQLGF